MKPFQLLCITLAAFACNKAGGTAEGDGGTPGKTATVQVTVSPETPLTTSRLLLSTTLTHNTFKYPANTNAVARAEKYLQNCTDCIGQFTMDWGAGNTNPAKDTYNYKYLDKRIGLAARLGRKIVLTLCRCPEWMRRDDPKKGVDAAPRPEMYGEFAHMAADFIRHYHSLGTDIFAVNVWSETRGYWSSTLNRWELEDYADLYNRVYDSIKAVDSRIRVGGPFMHIESSPKGKNMALHDGSISSSDRAALRAFLSKARALDFFSIDRNLKENGDATPYSEDEILRYTVFNKVVHEQCRELLRERFPDVPVWVVDNQCLKGHFPTDIEAAGLASMFRWHLLGGAEFVDKWQPEDEGRESTDAKQIAPEGLYTHTDTDDGAQPLPSLYIFRDFKTFFGPGTEIVKSTSTDENVETLASTNRLMLINKQNGEKKVEVQIESPSPQHLYVTLKRFEVKTIEY